MPSLPLANQTILVTRSAGQSGQFSDRLRAQGAQVIEMPALEIGPPSSWAALDQALAELEQFDWLILASVNGVTYVGDRLRQLGKNPLDMQNTKLAVVGEKTAQRLESYGLKPDFLPSQFIADALAAELPDAEIRGKRILFPRVEEGGRPALVQQLQARGALVTEVAAYASVCPSAMPPDAWSALQRQQISLITFASSKTVHCFHKLIQTALEPFDRPSLLAPMLVDLLKPCGIAAIGPQTAATCETLLGRVDVVAAEYTLDGLIQAMIQWAQR